MGKPGEHYITLTGREQVPNYLIVRIYCPEENIVDRVSSIWLRTPSESAVRMVIVGGFLVCIFRLLATPMRKSAIVSRFLVWEIAVGVGEGKEYKRGGTFWMHTYHQDNS